MRSLSKRARILLSVIISFNICFSPLFAYSTSPYNTSILPTDRNGNPFPLDKEGNIVFSPQFEGQTFEGITSFQGTQSNEELDALSKKLEDTLNNNPDPSNLEKLKPYDLPETIKTYYNFYLDKKNEVGKLIEEIGYEGFLDKLKKDQVFFKDPNLGEIRFTWIKLDEDKNSSNFEVVARATHDKSGVSFVFLPHGKMDPENKHLKQYLSRISFDAGSSRTKVQNKYIYSENGKSKKHYVRAGRDYIAIWENENRVIENGVSVHKRSQLFSKQWFIEWKNATVKKTDRIDVIKGLGLGAFQAAVGAMASGLIWWTAYQVDPSFAVSDTAMDSLKTASILSFIFGTAVGCNISTFKNWVQRHWPGRENFGTNFKNIMLTSIPFAVLLNALGPDGAERTLTLFDPMLWLTITHTAQNILANNMMKTALGQWTMAHDMLRDDKHQWRTGIPKKIHIDFKEWKVKVDYWKSFETIYTQSDINRQVHAYMPVQTMRLLDLLAFSWFIHRDGPESWIVPLAYTALLWVLVPFTYYTVNLKITKMGNDLSVRTKSQERWDHLKSTPRRVWDYLSDLPEKLKSLKWWDFVRENNQEKTLIQTQLEESSNLVVGLQNIADELTQEQQSKASNAQCSNLFAN